MRIMMVSAHYPPVLNGYAIQCKRTTEIFKKRGHQVCVLTSSVNSSYIEKDMRVLRILKSFPLEGYQSLQPIYILRQLKRRKVYQGNRLIAQGIAREFKPQVIMVWQFDSLGFGLIYGLQKLGIPIVFNVEDYGLHAIVSRLRKDPNPFWRMARRRLYQVHVDDLDISHLIMASEELKDFYINEGFPEDHITVVHNAIDSEYIAEKSPKLGLGNKLLYAGRIHPTKGIEIAIKALAILNAGTKGRFTLDIVGTGEIDYVRKLADLGRSLSLEASLQFLGPKDREVLIDLYREYDMLLFPSVWHEPFGLTVIEAMARGVPVIAINRGGPKNIITNMVDGILVESENPEMFAQAIALLANDPELRGRMAQLAIEKVRKKFTLEKHAVLTETFLLQAIAQVNRGAPFLQKTYSA